MATNRWLNDLKRLKSVTNTLRDTLRNRDIKVYDADTLPDLVAKVPQLSPIQVNEEEEYHWTPDPLWKFPDPNGTETTKTIREIYDEDTMAADYTYRGIYQIRADIDTFDLKAVMNKRTNADTFVLSDGTIYENVTETTKEHTWNRDKDIVDSTGQRMRYVRVYSKTEYTYVPSFYRQLVWGIHNLGRTTSVAVDRTKFSTDYIKNYPFSMYDYHYDCIEMEDKVKGQIQYDSFGKVKKLAILAETTSAPSGSSFLSKTYTENIKELYMPKFMVSGVGNIFNTESQTLKLRLGGTSTSSGSGTQLQFGLCRNLKNITYDDGSTCVWLVVYGKTDFAETALSSSRYVIIQNCVNFEIYDYPKTVTVLELSYLKQKTVSLPIGLTKITLTYMPNLSSVEIPSTCTDLTITYCGLKSLSISEQWKDITKINISELLELKDITVFKDYNITGINLTNSILLEHDSIIDLLDNLKDRSAETAYTLRLGAVNLAKLTDEEKEIATNKNWTLV